MNVQSVTMRAGRPAASWLLAAGLLAACGGGSSSSTAAPAASPAASDLLCGAVPRAAVVEALGRSDFQAVGAFTRPGSPQGARGVCVIKPPGSRDPMATVDFAPAASTRGRTVLAHATTGDSEYTFPKGETPGFGRHSRFVDSGGAEHRAGMASTVWGDVVITVRVNMPARGRDGLQDAVALTQQVGEAAKLPPVATTPVPGAS